jgi:hypothetical protein
MIFKFLNAFFFTSKTFESSRQSIDYMNMFLRVNSKPKDNKSRSIGTQWSLNRSVGTRSHSGPLGPDRLMPVLINWTLAELISLPFCISASELV